MPHCLDIGDADKPGLVATARQRMPLGEHIADRNFQQNRMKGEYSRITMNSAIIALASRMVTIGRGGPSVNGALLMTCLFRPAVVLVLGLLVAACGGGGPSLPGSSPAPLPGPPKDLDFEFTPLNEVLLTWAAPDPEPGRAPVTGYEIYLDEQARPVGVTGSLAYLYRGLVPGRTYVFHVRAVNRVGRSQAAGSVTVTVIAVQPPVQLKHFAPGAARVAERRIDGDKRDAEQRSASAVDGAGAGSRTRAGHELRGLPRAAPRELRGARRDRVAVVYPPQSVSG